MRTALLLVLSCVTRVMAQETLKFGQPVEPQLALTPSQSYSIALNAGDYVASLIDQHGQADLTIFAPAGSQLRRYPGPAGDGKRLCVFIADVSGTYRIEVTAPTSQPTSYKLTLNQILSLDERLKPKPWQDPNPSPRIEALRKQESSSIVNIETFWKEGGGEGTPHVVALEKDAQ